MAFVNLLRAGALALACLSSRPVSASPLIFGFGHVDSRPVQTAETWRCNWASRPHHHHVRIAARCAYTSRLARAGSSSLLDAARGYLGRGNFTGYREAWCADALRAWLRQSGHSTAGTDHRAISFARYGRPTSPHVGAVAVLRHHVGIVAAVTGRGVVLLSGNHGRRVALGVYPLRRILTFRDPV